MRRAALPALAGLCLLLCACTPEEPAPTLPGGIVVQTDWEQLGDREELPQRVGTRWYEEYTDRLIPREDYGPLIPYAGLRLMDDWPANDGCLYGLMTREGAAVTDPVYSEVYRPSAYDASGRWQTYPLLILKQGDPQADPQSADPALCAVAAADGSWCTPFDYRAVRTNRQGLLLFRSDSVTVMGTDGAVQRVWTVAEMGIPQEDFDSLLSDVMWGEGWGGDRQGDYMSLGWEPGRDDALRCFHLVSGEVTVLTEDEWYALPDGYVTPQPDPDPAVPDATRKTDRLLGDDAPGLLEHLDYSDAGMTYTYYREDGTPLPQLTLPDWQWYQQVNVTGGLIEVLDRDTASYYDLDTLECRFRTYLNYEGD